VSNGRALGEKRQGDRRVTRGVVCLAALCLSSFLSAPISAQDVSEATLDSEPLGLASVPVAAPMLLLQDVPGLSLSSQGRSVSSQPALQAAEGGPGADVKGALADSMKMLVITHLARITFQEKTRRELSGPFFRDYIDSVHKPQSWGDTDGWFVNDIGHPIEGAAAGYIWLDHEAQGATGVAYNRRYWTSRLRATAWAAAYSLQFEIGPLSEASIGNVGKQIETTGWTDYIVTPVGGLAMILLEEFLDRSVVRKIENRTTNALLRGALRTVLAPGRSVSNLASSRAPWYRDRRPLDWRP
jgi:hypothetical protein